MCSCGESQSQRQIQDYSNPVLLEQASDGWCVHYISINLVRTNGQGWELQDPREGSQILTLGGGGAQPGLPPGESILSA